MLIKSLLYNVRSVLPKVNQLRSSQQENFQNGLKLCRSTRVCFRPFQNDQKKNRLSIEYMKEFWGFFWFRFTFKIHNRCNSFSPTPMSETLGQIWPRSINPFFNLALQLCLQCKGIWRTYFLNPGKYGLNNLQYFGLFLGSGWSFPAQTCHNPSNINFHKVHKIVLDSFWIMPRRSSWFLHRLIKTFFGNRASRVSPFSG